MKIGVLVGQNDRGGYEYLGVPGDVTALKKLQAEIIAAGGNLVTGSGNGKAKKHYVKTWVANAASNPIRARKS